MGLYVQSVLLFYESYYVIYVYAYVDSLLQMYLFNVCAIVFIINIIYSSAIEFSASFQYTLWNWMYEHIYYLLCLYYSLLYLFIIHLVVYCLLVVAYSA